MTIEQRLLTAWDKTTQSEREAGAQWYPEAHKFADSLAFWTDRSLDTTAAIISALSPQLSWELNQYAAQEFVQGNARPKGVLKASWTKAQDLDAGLLPSVAFDSVRCPKTNAFYHNIRDWRDCRYVTIDRHAARLALGKDSERFDYVSIARAYRNCARRLSLVPCAFQATLWLAERARWQIPFAFPQQSRSEQRRS